MGKNKKKQNIETINIKQERKQPKHTNVDINVSADQVLAIENIN